MTYVELDHTTCPPEAHDRLLPDDPRDAAEVTRAADGLLGCAECREPLFWCLRDEQYHHVDPDAECFLVASWGDRS